MSAAIPGGYDIATIPFKPTASAVGLDIPGEELIMAITANDVKTLRDRTNAPMMECKTALNEAGGDMEKAIEWLRKKAGSKISNFTARETGEGRIGVYLDTANKVGALVEVRCETAPVSKTDQFIQLTSEIAKQVAL